VKVRHDEGIASLIGPKPCADIREDISEASVGENIGAEDISEASVGENIGAIEPRKITSRCRHGCQRGRQYVAAH